MKKPALHAGLKHSPAPVPVEPELREKAEWFRTIFENASDGILIADVETRKFRYANPAICRMLGYTEDELCAMGVPDIHPPDALAHVLAEFEILARGEKTLATDIPCLRKDGSIVPADINGVPITFEGKSCTAGFFRDITERKRAEAKLKERMEELLSWETVTLRRERRVLELKQEVNDLLAKLGKPPRYENLEGSPPDR